MADDLAKEAMEFVKNNCMTWCDFEGCSERLCESKLKNKNMTKLNNGTEPKEYSIKQTVKAIQFMPETATDIVQWTEGSVLHGTDAGGVQFLVLNGTDVHLGDYIVQGHGGRFFAVKQSAFPNAYEAV